MNEVFTTSLCQTFLAVLRVFIIMLAAGLLVRRRIITQDQIKTLAAVTIEIFLPCMIFSKIIRNFQPDTFTIWYLLPLSAVVMIGIGMLIGAVFFWRSLKQSKNMLALCSIQNAGYLVLPIGAALYPNPQEFDRFALYCFLYILGMSPLLWSIGKYLTTSSAKSENKSSDIDLQEQSSNHTVFNLFPLSFFTTRWKGFITPPFIANVLAVLMVFTGLRRWIPSPVLDAADLLGTAAVPVANFIIGAVLGGISLKLLPYMLDTLRVIASKLILLPLLMILVLWYFKSGITDPVLAVFFILQAASPPATGLVLQVKKYGGDVQRIGSIMFVCYGLCVITMPLTLAMWSWISG